jgi:ABC-type transporter Mla MlaB component
VHTTGSAGQQRPSLRREGSRLLFAGELTMDTVTSLMPEAREGCANGVEALDFAGVTTLDSAAIALLLELGRARGAPLRLENLPPAALKLAQLYSVADQLGVGA